MGNWAKRATFLIPCLAKAARHEAPVIAAIDYFFGNSAGFGCGVDACSLVGGTMFFIRM